MARHAGQCVQGLVLSSRKKKINIASPTPPLASAPSFHPIFWPIPFPHQPPELTHSFLDPVCFASRTPTGGFGYTGKPEYTLRFFTRLVKIPAVMVNVTWGKCIIILSPFTGITGCPSKRPVPMIMFSMQWTAISAI